MTDHRRPVGVRVTVHARERYVERFPGVTPDQATKVIYREVQQALVENRFASKLPSWCERAGYDNYRRSNRRFAWNEDKTRCYPIVRDNSREHERSTEFGVRWTVATVLVALSEEQQAEQERLRQVDREKVGNRKQRYGTLVFGGRAKK